MFFVLNRYFLIYFVFVFLFFLSVYTIMNVISLEIIVVRQHPRAFNGTSWSYLFIYMYYIEVFLVTGRRILSSASFIFILIFSQVCPNFTTIGFLGKITWKNKMKIFYHFTIYFFFFCSILSMFDHPSYQHNLFIPYNIKLYISKKKILCALTLWSRL